MAPNNSTRREFLTGWRPFGGIFGGAGAAFESGGPRARLEDAVRSVGLGPAIDMGAGLRESTEPATYLPDQGDPESGGATERLRGLARSFTELLHTPMTRRAAIGGMVVGAAALAGCLGGPQQPTNSTRPGSVSDPFAYDSQNGLGPAVPEFRITTSKDGTTDVFLQTVTSDSVHSAIVVLDGKVYQLQARTPLYGVPYATQIPGILATASQHTFSFTATDKNGHTTIAGTFYGRPEQLTFRTNQQWDASLGRLTDKIETELQQHMVQGSLQARAGIEDIHATARIINFGNTPADTDIPVTAINEGAIALDLNSTTPFRIALSLDFKVSASDSLHDWPTLRPHRYSIPLDLGRIPLKLQ